MIASEIADKVRANRECQDEYASTSKFFGNVYTVGTSSGSSVPTCTYTAALGSAGMDNERNCIINNRKNCWHNIPSSRKQN